jgi:uncharacterized 2Fe-2S/4Fe-4S cluster protein (DUF4445 family)
MSRVVRIDVPAATPLRGALFELGVEFPCGGAQLCGACRIRVLDGDVPITSEMRAALTDDELAAGWRLGCFARSAGPVTMEVEQWTAPVLAGAERLPTEAAPGRAIAIDLGTTTLAAQLVDRASGDVLATVTALNPQARHGADLMSRVAYDADHPGELTALIRAALGAMVAQLAGDGEIAEVLLCGNTAMHHLFCGIPATSLASAPFRTPHLAAQTFSGAKLGWGLEPLAGVTMLPNIGGFVGSDILAGLVACGVAKSEKIVAFVDLGTNGEVAIGSRAGIVCASTAAGPAFEAGRIGQGMRAGAGAIESVDYHGGALVCQVIGAGPARGLCGSGLVDAAAALLDARLLQASGRMAHGMKQIELAPGVVLAQADIRELQLAKGAIAAGALLLRRELLAPPPERMYLAGAFGNYVRDASARRIGLLPARGEIVAAGNTALRGTRLLVLHPRSRAALIETTLSRTAHIELGGGTAFQDAFADCLALAPLDWDQLGGL